MLAYLPFTLLLLLDAVYGEHGFPSAAEIRSAVKDPAGFLRYQAHATGLSRRDVSAENTTSTVLPLAISKDSR